MPISQILTDGRVEIYNSKTGDRKVVAPEELGNYNPAMISDYNSMKQASELGAAGVPVKDIQADPILRGVQAEQVKRTGITPAETGTAEQQFKKQQATRAITELEKLYGRGDAANVGTKNDLSMAANASGLSKGITAASRAVKGFFGDKTREDVNKYRSQLEAYVGILTQAFGSGTPQEGEFKRLINSAPNEISTNEEAKQWFESVRNILGTGTLKPPTDQKKNEQVSGVDTTQTVGADIQPTQPSGPSFLDRARTAISDAAGALPVIGGTIGGIGGSIAGGIGGAAAGAPAAGIGAIPGALAGGTALGALGVTGGTGTGIAAREAIRTLLGTREKEEVPGTLAREAVVEPLAAGALDLVTGGAFKLVGKAGGLVLKSASKMVDDIPFRSIRANPGQILEFTKKHGQNMADFMVNNKILGDDAIEVAAGKAATLQDSFDNLALNESIQIPVQKLKDRFTKEIADLAGATVEGGKTKIVPKMHKEIAEKVLGEWKNIEAQLAQMGTENVTPKMITEFRRMIDEVIPNSQFVEPSVKNIAVRTRKIMNDIVQEATDDAFQKNPNLIGQADVSSLKDLGNELSKYYDFLRITEKQSGLGKGNLVLNPTRIATGGGGAGLGLMLTGGNPLGGLAGGITGLASEALLRDPTVLAKIFKGGKVAQKVGGPIGKGVSAASKALSSLIGAGGASMISE